MPGEVAERKPNLHPALGGQIANDPIQHDRYSEVILFVFQLNEWQISRGNRFGRIAPEIKRVAAEICGAIAHAHYADFGFPTSARHRARLQAERVRSSKKNLLFDRQRSRLQLN